MHGLAFYSIFKFMNHESSNLAIHYNCLSEIDICIFRS